MCQQISKSKYLMTTTSKIDEKAAESCVPTTVVLSII